MEGYDVAWFIAVPVATAILGFGIAWAMFRVRSTTPAERAAGERGAERLYRTADEPRRGDQPTAP